MGTFCALSFPTRLLYDAEHNSFDSRHSRPVPNNIFAPRAFRNTLYALNPY